MAGVREPTREELGAHLVDDLAAPIIAPRGT
jgi:hypothetical protein